MTAPGILGHLIDAMHWLAGLIVLLESLERLDHACLLERGLRGRVRAARAAKAIGWMLLAAGAAGALITPLVPAERPTLQDACVLCGVAVLSLRQRIARGKTRASLFKPHEKKRPANDRQPPKRTGA